MEKNNYVTERLKELKTDEEKKSFINLMFNRYYQYYNSKVSEIFIFNFI